ncbi:MAG TPA: hypothetical protein VK464_04095 [Symbiobacteriaceae bacterium]|nr:hypothetical protein [Symbiobacteriaceae bacterium]
MNHDEKMGLAALLPDLRQALEQAPEEYSRTFAPEEYWWLSVALAAITLAQMGEKPYAVGRLEQLMDKAGHKGIRGDWFQRFTEELAELDAEGLIWPVYERSPEGPFIESGARVHGGFDAHHGCYLALAHLGVALSVLREDQSALNSLFGAIGSIVTSGLTAEHEQLILAVLKPTADEA